MDSVHHPVERAVARAATQVDSRRWACVESLMEVGEQPLNNASGRLLRDAPGPDGPLGYVLLSDRAMYLFIPADPGVKLPSPGQSHRIPLQSISHVRSEIKQVMHVEWDDPNDATTSSMDFDLGAVPGVGPLAAAFYGEVLSAVTAAQRE
jgi:hypothetical protein